MSHSRLKALTEDWETLDIADLLKKRDVQREETTSANVGAYPMPFKGVLRRTAPVAAPEPADMCADFDCDYYAAVYGR